MILVTGATGTVGYQLVMRLAADGHDVRALVRDPERAAALRSLDVDLVLGDFAVPKTLDAALKGIDRAFLLPPSSLQQVRYETNFIEAAQRAGLRHLVKLSVIAADIKSTGPITQWHGMAERRIEATSIPYTFLRPALYMQDLLWLAADVRESGTVHLPLEQMRVALVDARDVAAVAAAMLTESGHEGRTYTLTGPDVLTPPDIARHLSTAAGREIGFASVGCADFKRVVMNRGVQEAMADAFVSIWRSAEDGRFAAVTADVEQVLGRRAAQFSRFACDYAHAFPARRAPAAVS